MKFAVGLLLAATTSHRFSRGDDGDRVYEIEQCLEALENLIKTQAFPSTQFIKGILVAPEYFFTRQSAYSGQIGKTIQNTLTVEQRDSIVSRLGELSKRFPDILMVPGSIVWQKSFERGDSGADRYARAVGHINHYLDMDATLPKLRDVASRKGTIPFDRGEVDVTTLGNAKKAELISEKKIPFYTRNTAYCFLGGKIIYKYHKAGDYFEASNNNETLVFIPSRKAPVCMLEVASKKMMSFGFEICLDHDIERLKSYLASSGQDAVDFHIVCSATIPSDQANMCMKVGGFFIHASTMISNTEVYQRNDASYVKLNADSTEIVETDSLLLYTLTTDASDASYLAKVRNALIRYKADRNPIFGSSESKHALNHLLGLCDQGNAAEVRRCVDWYLDLSMSKPQDAGAKLPKGKKFYEILSAV